MEVSNLERLFLYSSDINLLNQSFFSTILAHPDVQKYKEEVVTCAGNHSKEKDSAKHTANFKRLRELKDMTFAKQIAATL